jgi:hypothetical protein
MFYLGNTLQIAIFFVYNAQQVVEHVVMSYATACFRGLAE